VEEGPVEREVKLRVETAFRLPDLTGVKTGVTVAAQPDRHLTAVYFDTADLRLVRHGLTLRHRSDGGARQARAQAASDVGEWTLKLPAPPEGPGLTRRELRWPGDGSAPPSDAVSLVRAFRRRAALVPVGRLVTHRQPAVVCGRAGRPLLEVVDDTVSVMEGGRLAARFREIEVEVVGAAPALLVEAVVARLVEAGAAEGGETSKLARALGPAAVAPPDVEISEVGAGSTMPEVVAAAVGRGYLRLIEHDLALRLGEDPEDVHQARVATRRLRSDLRTFRPLLERAWYGDSQTELGWLADLLGRLRDLDVLAARIEHHLSSLGDTDARAGSVLVERLRKEREPARADLLDALNSDRYGALLDRLVAATRRLPSAPGAARAKGQEAATDLVAEPWKRLLRAVERLGPHPSDEALHKVRIRTKRLRYACNAVAGVVGTPAHSMAKAAADLQDILGELHDAAVAAEWLRLAATDLDVSEALIAGQLIALHRVDAEAARSKWPDAWARLSRQELRAWLR
jgi:CHAD domain-containing protein